MDMNIVNWVQNPIWLNNIYAAMAYRQKGERWELGEYFYRLAYAKYHTGSFFRLINIGATQVAPC